MSPMLHIVHDCEKLFVIDVIIDFSSTTLLGPVGNEIPLLAVIKLAENARNSEIRCIRVQVDR